MILRCSRRKNRGLTLVETVVVIFSLFILAVTLLAAVSAPRLRTALGCVNQLKQSATAFKLWSGDHGEKFPMAVSGTKGGAMEPALQGNAEAIFQVLSNELSTPKSLICPADKASRAAARFNVPLAATNLSYFVNADSSEPGPHEMILGDDNLKIHGVRVKSGRLELVANQRLDWTPDRHKFYGNIALADGSAQAVRNSVRANFLEPTNTAGLRLAIP
jgi:prepilin-type processing-associated H-X9-DG protein